MPFTLKPWLIKIWHAPEHFRLFDPLPPAHRRGIIACILFIAICFLWPASTPTARPQTVPLNNNNSVPLQANLVVSAYPVDGSESSLSPDNSINLLDDTATRQPEQEAQQEENRQTGWQNYQIAPGQTMAQLFRDNNLPPTDVYAMAQVEGSDKPLSNLQAGQTVRINKDQNGVVRGLSIDNEKDNKSVHFTRQQDGSFKLGY